MGAQGLRRGRSKALRGVAEIATWLRDHGRRVESSQQPLPKPVSAAMLYPPISQMEGWEKWNLPKRRQSN